ncbi:dienelactone hydrolase family protein [bacterium]|nr:dienelactone hydrolase family protein [bacterium]
MRNGVARYEALLRSVRTTLHVVFLLLVFGGGSPVAALTEGEEVKYSYLEKSYGGYLALPPKRHGIFRLPAVFVVHDPKGAQGQARALTRRLSEDLEVVALLIERGADAGALKDPFRGAMHFFRQRDDVDLDKLGVVGFGEGGRAVLELLQQEFSFRAVVLFHPRFPDMSGAERIETPVFVAHGATDGADSRKALRRFQEQMRVAQNPLQVVVYAGAKENFTAPLAEDAPAIAPIESPFTEDELVARDIAFAAWREGGEFMRSLIFQGPKKRRFR